MRVVTSDALGTIGKSIGLSGSGSQVTEFLDGILEQTLDVTPFVRRGRTQAATTGLYTGIIRNVHTDAETIVTGTDPFQAEGVIPPYPPRVSSMFDIWLLVATVQRISGAGTLTAAGNVNYSAASQGWGVDDSGTAIVNTISMPFAFWDSTVAQSGNIGLQESGDPMSRPLLRLRPGATIEFSSTSSLTATFDMQVLLGIFPVSLGQDIAG